MSKIIKITENQYKSILKEDNEEYEIKVKWLFESGIEENIVLAFQLIASLKLDRHLLVDPYIGLFLFLKRFHQVETEDFSIEAMIEMTNMTYLDLGNYKLTSLPTSMKKLVNLKQLLLWRNKFEKTPEVIYKLKNLRIIDLGGNPISDEELHKLRTLLPNLEVQI